MAGKKTARKDGKQSRGDKTAPPREKKALPAFGLAEEILGGAREQADSVDRVDHVDVIDGKMAPPARNNGNAVASVRNEQSQLAAGPELHLVTFILDQEEYGVDIDRVREIIRVGQITAVPNAPEFVKGVINLRGRVIPVLGLRRRLDLPEGHLTKDSRIMVVESGARALGLLVDGVSQVLRMPAAAVEAPPGDAEQAKVFIKGIAKVDSRLIMLMDLDRVLAKNARAGETAQRA